MKRAFRGGARSETLNPDPVTELPLTPPAEEDEEEAAISPRPSLEEQKGSKAELGRASRSFPGHEASDHAQYLTADDGGEVQEEPASGILGCRPCSVAPQPQSAGDLRLPCMRGRGCLCPLWAWVQLAVAPRGGTQKLKVTHALTPRTTGAWEFSGRIREFVKITWHRSPA